jgi:hypothetical protein
VRSAARRPNVSSGYEIGGGGMAASTGERLLGFAIGLERLEARLAARNGPEDAVVVGLRGELAKTDATLALIVRPLGVGNLANQVERFAGATLKQFLQVALVGLASIQATLGNFVAGGIAPLKRQIRGRRRPPMAKSRGLPARKIM